MAIHCPECRFEFPEGLHPLPSQCPRCGAPLYFAEEPAPPPQPRRRPNYGFLRHSPTAGIILLCVIAYLVEAVLGRSIFEPHNSALVRAGATYGPMVFAGQWWRLFTAMFLHGSILHIAFNMWALFNLGLLAEILYGRRNYIFLYLLCGFGGSVASVWWHPQAVGVGASGAIFGLAGALLPALKFQKNPRIAAALKGALGSIAMFVVYNLAIGAAMPFIDNAAHIGGLVTGLFLGVMLPSYTVEEERKRTGQAVLAFVTAFAIIAYGAMYARKKYAPNKTFAQAETLLRSGKPDQAIALYQNELKKNPDDEELQAQYALVLDQAKKYPEELEVMKKLAGAHPEDARYQAALCGAQVKNGDLQSALPSCKKATELDPKNSGYLFALGSLYSNLKQNPEAVAAFRKAYDLKPEGFTENLLLGIALLEDGQKPEAQQKLQKAVQLNPRDRSAQLALKAAEK